MAFAISLSKLAVMIAAASLAGTMCDNVIALVANRKI